MRAALFILVILMILMAWTAVRYRKQITSILGFIQMVRGAASSARPPAGTREMKAAVPNELVNCAKCGVWVPHDRAIRFDAKTFYCSKECVTATLTAN